MTEAPTLPHVLAEIERELMEGLHSRHHPYHLLTLATLDAEGVPDARTLVLRHVDTAARLVGFHTDFRSPKCQILAANPRARVLFYNPKTKIQLRLRVRATLHHRDAVAEAAWAKTRLMSRRCYLITEAPGTETATMQSGLPPELERRDPNLEESEVGFDHFCVVHCHFDRIDYLKLKVTGHIRAQFDWAVDGVPSAQWLIP